MAGQPSKHNSIIDHCLVALTEHPRQLILFIGLISMGLFSIPALLMGMLLSVVLKWTDTHFSGVLVMMGVGVLTIIGSGLSNGIWIKEVHHQNVEILHALIRGSLSHLPWVFWVLSTLPYALIWGGIWALVSRWGLGLRREVSRVASGRILTQSRPVSERRLAHALGAISSAACEGGTILGVNRYTQKPVVLSDRDANLHTLAIGTTGSGKTTTIANLIESALLHHHPLFYVDGKGDLALAERMAALARQLQVPFYRFSMIGDSLKYNPIAFGGFTSKKDRIIELRHWSEDHYRKLAEGYLQTVFKLLATTNKVLDLHTLSNYLTPESLYGLAREVGDSSWVERIEILEAQWRDISSLVAEIQTLAQSEIGSLFDCREGEVITLDKAFSENALVYFGLQPLAFPAYAETLGKLIINDIKALAASLLTSGQPRPLFVLLDEFSVFAGDPIVHLINQGRGAGIHCVLSTQSLSDIERKGGDALLGQVLNNVNNYIIQRQNNPVDAEVLANLIGTAASFQVTSQLSAERGGTGLGSVTQTREFIVHPDEIKRLALGQAIIVNKQFFQVQPICVRQGRW